MPVVDLATVKRHLKIDAAVTTHDADLTEWIAGVTEVVEWYIGPVDDRTVVERWRGGLLSIAVRETPVVAVTSVTDLTGSEVVDPADVDVDTATGQLQLISATRWPTGRLLVTYTAGRGGTPPKSAVVAALMILQHLWEVRRGADTRRPAFSPVEQVATVQTPNYTYSVPRRALQLLEAKMTGPAIA